MECAQTIAAANGVDASRWHTVEASAASVLALGNHSIDVAMSLLSCGFHYQVQSYASAIASVLKPNGRLIITLRRGKAGQREHLAELGFRCHEHPYEGSAHDPKVMFLECRAPRPSWVAAGVRGSHSDLRS